MEAHKSFHSTTILVSHDVDEITRLSDQVYVIDNGRIVNSGNAGSIFKDQDVNLSYIGKITAIEKNKIEVEFLDNKPGSYTPGDVVNISVISNPK